MTTAITLWLAFTLSVGAISYFGTRRQALAFLAVSIATGFASTIPLGHPSYDPPPGEYTVLGARIDVDEAIYVLLDGPIPKYYRLPYSAGTANQLQQALDGAADGEGTATMRQGQDGSPGFAEDHGPPEEAKRAEVPLL